MKRKRQGTWNTKESPDILISHFCISTITFFSYSDRKVNLKGMKMSMRYQDCVLIAHTLNVLRGPEVLNVYMENRTMAQQQHTSTTQSTIHIYCCLNRSIKFTFCSPLTSLFYSSIYFTALKFNLEVNLPCPSC